MLAVLMNMTVMTILYQGVPYVGKGFMCKV